jgi:hypothetical protein
MTTLSVILAFFGSHCETLRAANTQGDRMGVIATLFIVIAGLFIVIASPKAWQSQENQNSKIKG